MIKIANHSVTVWKCPASSKWFVNVLELMDTDLGYFKTEDQAIRAANRKYPADNESNIVYERDGYWVSREVFKSGACGYKVWKNGLTHSSLVATCGYDGERGLMWCKEFINRKVLDIE